MAQGHALGKGAAASSPKSPPGRATTRAPHLRISNLQIPFANDPFTNHADLNTCLSVVVLRVSGLHTWMRWPLQIMSTLDPCELMRCTPCAKRLGMDVSAVHTRAHHPHHRISHASLSPHFGTGAPFAQCYATGVGPLLRAGACGAGSSAPLLPDRHCLAATELWSADNVAPRHEKE